MHTQGMDDTTNAPDPSRRAFLVGVCGAAALTAGGLGTALLADDAWAARGITRRRDGRVVVNVDRVPALRRDNSRVLLGNVKGTPVAIVRQGDTFTALNLRCTHQGVTVNSDPSGWRCPAHGSLFALDGDLERGPALSPLGQYTSRWNARRRRLIVG
jgi:cytochrome b6-f complex iron-sulfur subunit